MSCCNHFKFSHNVEKPFKKMSKKTVCWKVLKDKGFFFPTFSACMYLGTAQIMQKKKLVYINSKECTKLNGKKINLFDLTVKSKNVEDFRFTLLGSALLSCFQMTHSFWYMSWELVLLSKRKFFERYRPGYGNINNVFFFFLQLNTCTAKLQAITISLAVASNGRLALFCG